MFKVDYILLGIDMFSVQEENSYALPAYLLMSSLVGVNSNNHCVKAALVTSFQVWIHNVYYFIWIWELAREEGGKKEDIRCTWNSCMCSLRLVTDKPLFPSLAAYFNDIAVGAVCCRVDHSQNQKRLYIMTLGCLAPYRRLGIGKESLFLYLSIKETRLLSSFLNALSDF